MGQLGDNAFQVRETASRHLREAGLSARPALRIGLKHQDAEVRIRCRRILAAIERRLENQIVKAFLADKDAENDHGMAGWKAVRKALGHGPAIRKLFVDMYRADRELFQAVAQEGGKLNEIFSSRMAEIKQLLTHRVPPFRGVRRRIPLATAAALLFVAGDPSVKLTNVTTSYLIYQSEVNSHLNGGEHKAELLKLVGRFVGREVEDDALAYQNFTLALRFGLRESVPPALKFLAKKDALPQYKAYALLVVGKFGKTKHLEAIKALLNDKTQVYPGRGANGRFPTTQLRDVAMAITIHINGGQLNQFGFTSARMHPQYLFHPSTLRFANDVQREAAFKKFNEWMKTKSK